MIWVIVYLYLMGAGLLGFITWHYHQHEYWCRSELILAIVACVLWPVIAPFVITAMLTS